MGNDTNSGFDKLKDSNYGPWSKLLKALLIRKGLWDVVSGDETLPNGSPNTKPVRAFRKKQAEAGAEIILHVEPSQLPFIKLFGMPLPPCIRRTGWLPDSLFGALFGSLKRAT
jgi:hypothetical protein